jgi:hypothetical protein
VRFGDSLPLMVSLDVVEDAQRIAVLEYANFEVFPAEVMLESLHQDFHECD